MRQMWIAFLVAVLFLTYPVSFVLADGIIIPPPCSIDECPPPPCTILPCPPFPPRPISQLNIKYHRVDVRIDRQVAVTRVDQVFFNPNEYAIEGTYLFPLPVDAVVNDFKLWVDGEPVDGKVLPAEEARKVYEEIVINLRDPALLEYIGRGAVQARIFPIVARGERRVQLEYSQILTAENGLVRYIYPLSTEKFSLQPLEQVSVRVEIRSEEPVRAVYSPTHPVDIIKREDQAVWVGWEAENVLPDTDFAVYFSVGESEAFHLLSYRNPADESDPDGFFALLLAPRPGAAERAIAKDVILVLDRSGSMDGEKFIQAQSALRYVLGHLGEDDRFQILTFSTGVESYARSMRPAGEAAEAIAWVDQLSAAGSTDINRALLEAISFTDAERPTYLVFLTDGLPTIGELDSQKILDNINREAPGNLRLFTFGVGYDVDTVLLDSLSGEHHGLSTYVRPEEPLDEVLSAFYERISTPVMTDVGIDFGALRVYDLYPMPLPDLFAGTQTIVVGRYRTGGQADLRLSGDVNGERVELEFAEQNFAVDSRGETGELSAIPRLWATRKIGYLLNQIRLKGPDAETIDQIVRLSVRYGIITPYTSYLVTEPMPLGAESQAKIAEEAYNNAVAAPMAPSGEGAFDRAAQEGELQAADVAPGSGANTQTSIRVVGQRTFLFQERTWTDTSFDPQMPVEVVPFLSERYFELARSRPDIGAAFALGERVILVVEGRAYQVGEMDVIAQPTEEVALPTQSPQASNTPVPESPSRSNSLCGTILVPLLALMVTILIRKRLGS